MHFTEDWRDGVLYYSLPDCPQLCATFSGKAGGTSVPEGVITGSAHGGRIDVAGEGYKLAEKTIDRPDGFITRQKNLKLICKVADCATVLLVHPPSGTFGLAHAGWRGVCAGAAGNLAGAIQSNFSVPPGELQALITPYADGKKYYVGVQDVPDWINVYAEFKKVFSQNLLDKIFVPHESDAREAYLDIGLALKYQLGQAGIRPENITVSEFRTISDERFWSSRVQVPPESIILGLPRPLIKHNIMCAYMK